MPPAWSEPAVTRSSSNNCSTIPAKLPPPVVERMSTLSKKALESPDLVKAYLDLGATAWWSTTQEVTAYRASEEARLAEIIKKAGAKVD